MPIAAHSSPLPVARTIALIGNPNVGKTTLFNALTGLKHQVGNYPGVTVEVKRGTVKIDRVSYTLVDLPGTYSLAARSPDEMLVADLLLGKEKGEHVDAILAIVDASNLERNLYLLSQLKEFGLPIVVSLNMTDVAGERGIEVNADRLSELLKLPVIPTRADKSLGMMELAKALKKSLSQPAFPSALHPSLPKEMEHAVLQLGESLRSLSPPIEIPSIELFRALVDREGYAEARLRTKAGAKFGELLERSRNKLAHLGSLQKLETNLRYKEIRAMVEKSVRRSTVRVRSATDRIDAILTHRLFGSLALIFILGIVFQSIYSGSAPFMDGIESFFRWVEGIVGGFLSEGPLRSLLVDGVLGGVGAVVGFVPQIAILFLFIALLEDCGYMARAAFLMDRLFASVGLTGRSVIPLISSFACAVPGILATRTIDNRKQRLATMLVAPFMSCSARLPVYVLFIGAFVPSTRYLGGWIGLQGLALFGMHLVGVAVAIPTLWLLHRTLLRGPPIPFMMELPSYKWPTVRTIFSRVYESAREFLVRAGTIIFALTIVVWALSYYPRPTEIRDRYQALAAHATSPEETSRFEREEAGEYLRQSYFGRLGHLIEPAVRPLGWDWRIGVATLAAFPAREVIISTLGTLYNLGAIDDETDPSLVHSLQTSKRSDGSSAFNLAVAFSVMVFFALCCQCGATLATIKRESKSWLWPGVTFLYMTAVAYVAAFAVYQSLLRWGFG